MSHHLYLSRLRIARTPAISAMAQLLNPTHLGQRMDAHHRLLWSAFNDNNQASRDFLWRDEGNDSFLVLSARPPLNSPLFEAANTQAFDPDLRVGDQLAFVLRANATRTIKTGRTSSNGKPHKQHIDLVMHELHQHPKEKRIKLRMATAQRVAEEWLNKQGLQHGFEPNTVFLQDYSVRALPGRGGARQNQPQLGVLDLTGQIAITNPAAFMLQMAHGFGRAKAFGCGLMLIRRG